MKLIVNDSVKIAKILKADGCHLGQKDGGVIKARNHLRKKIIGVTCHNSKILAKIAIKEKSRLFSFWIILQFKSLNLMQKKQISKF